MRTCGASSKRLDAGKGFPDPTTRKARIIHLPVWWARMN
jgi:hypothetical protein